MSWLEVLHQLFEKTAGVGALVGGDCLRGALDDNPSTSRAAFGPKVNNPVRSSDHVQVVLNHDHRVSLVGKPLQDVEKFFDIVEVQPCGRFVKNIDCSPRRAALQFCRKLDSLRLAAGERRG